MELRDKVSVQGLRQVISGTCSSHDFVTLKDERHVFLHKVPRNNLLSLCHLGCGSRSRVVWLSRHGAFAVFCDVVGCFSLRHATVARTCARAGRGYLVVANYQESSPISFCDDVSNAMDLRRMVDESVVLDVVRLEVSLREVREDARI